MQRSVVPRETYGSIASDASHVSGVNTEFPSRRRVLMKVGILCISGVACLAVCSSFVLGSSSAVVMVQKDSASSAAVDKQSLEAWEKSLEGTLLWGEFSGDASQGLNAPWPWDEKKPQATKASHVLKQKKAVEAKKTTLLKQNNKIVKDLEAKSQKVKTQKTCARNTQTHTNHACLCARYIAPHASMLDFDVCFHTSQHHTVTNGATPKERQHILVFPGFLEDVCLIWFKMISSPSWN
jgi:hypothetical protein